MASVGSPLRRARTAVRVDGDIAVDEPSDAIALGIGFVTADPKPQGVVLGMSVRETVSLTHLKVYSPALFVNRQRDTAACRGFVQSLGIKTPPVEQRIVNRNSGDQRRSSSANGSPRPRRD